MPSADMIGGVIFDIDGTLLDSMGVWMNAGKNYLEGMGISPEPDLGAKLFPMTMEEGARYLRDTYALPFSPAEIAEQVNLGISDAYANRVALKPGAGELLSRLAERGVPLAVATSTDRLLAEKALRRLGVLELFRGVFSSAETGRGKDRPDLYLAAASLLGAPAEDVWVFEDALYAARTAVRAGFRLAAVYDESGADDWEALSSLAAYRVRDARDFGNFLC